MQWLANASKLSLDWQELPPGYLNLTTQRAYTLPEARDLINRHLQARGYVMLLAGEVLSVSKIDRLDPSLVPRATEDELYDLQPHDFVKVTYQLPEGMQVKQASEDIKQALSKHAKLLPLAATKRLLAIDAVANLRLVSSLLNEERVEKEGRVVPKRFVLRYARAEQVINTLYVVMGLDPASRPSQQEIQYQTKKLDLLKQMQQKGKDVAKMLNSKGPPVYLAYNRNDNSILANAPPEQLEMIERTIKMLDIPRPGVADSTATPPEDRFAKTYELQSIEPDSLISSLEEVGNLNPLTDLRGDRKSKVLFAHASKGDHEQIEKIISQLDGPKERVEVFSLRRHLADEVGDTLLSLIGGEDADKDRKRRWNWWDMYRDDDEDGQLRVEADLDNNRLFVRANDTQMAEVRAFLTQIGEIDDPSVGLMAERPVRVVEGLDRAATDKLLEQLRASWPAMGDGSELNIEDARSGQTDASAAGAGQASPSTTPGQGAEPRKEKDAPPAGNRTTQKPTRFRFAADSSKAENKSPKEPNAAAVTVTEDGRLVLSSDDPELLRRLEQLVETLSPPQKTFTEFRLKHVSARYVQSKLDDFYEEILDAGFEEKFNQWGEYQGRSRARSGGRVSPRRDLRMVYNVVTNSIVVTNALPAQLREIQRLIDIWDQPPMEDIILQRRTGMVKVQYSQARTIASALKDVYRDLLSARDKEFDTEDERGGGFTTEKLTQIEYSGAEVELSGGTPTRKTEAIETTFDGALSIGVDELANMLVISADAELYGSVVDMIQKLDDQARPRTTVQVVRVGVPAESLREALDDALDRPWPGGKPEQRRRSSQNGRQREDRNRDNGDRRRR
ncbi:MAG: secretin N-terminal domain-containing protein [Planctomycetota bacterium]